MNDWKAWEGINQAHSLVTSIPACPESTCQRHGAASALYRAAAGPHLPEVGGGGGGNGSNWVSCRVGVRQRERGVEEGLDSSPNSEAWAAVGGSLSDLCPHSWLYGKELGKWVWVPRMPAG